MDFPQERHLNFRENPLRCDLTEIFSNWTDCFELHSVCRQILSFQKNIIRSLMLAEKVMMLFTDATEMRCRTLSCHENLASCYTLFGIKAQFINRNGACPSCKLRKENASLTSHSTHLGLWDSTFVVPWIVLLLVLPYWYHNIHFVQLGFWKSQYLIWS